MQISVSHTTRYRFDTPPGHGLQRLRLKPKTSHGQAVHDWHMAVEGAHVQALYDDHNHNQTALISFAPDAQDIVVTCSGLVETADNAGMVGPHTGCMPLWSFIAPTDLTRPGERLQSLAARFQDSSARPLDRLRELSATVHDAVTLATEQTDAGTTAEMALSAGQGLCQDHSHIFIAAARLLDIPARYVSGYVLMDGAQQAGHGWAEAHLDDHGWVGFDVGNGVSTDERYVRVATGFDYRDAAPVTGTSLGAAACDSSVSLALTRGHSAQQQAGAPRQT